MVALVAFLVIGCRGESHDLVTTPGLDAAPSPLFDRVEQLTPEPLPTGWARCGGRPSTLPGAGAGAWSQTFGPVDGGSCDPWITITQLPLDGDVELPTDGGDAKVGDADAMPLSDRARGMQGLLTWAFDQNLVVEACCDAAAAEHLDAMTLAALEATRQRAAAGCTAPESDLDREPLVRNLIGKSERLFDLAGCPIRTDIATMKIEPDDHHCWPGAGFVSIGTPLGEPMDATGARVYARDASDGFGDLQLAPLDLHAELPSTARDTGWSQEGRGLWVDEVDDTYVYVVTDDATEAWPRLEHGPGCA